MIALLPMSEESTIEIGHHVTREWMGMTFNIDTIISTIVAGLIVLLMGLLVRRAAGRKTEDHVPRAGSHSWRPWSAR